MARPKSNMPRRNKVNIYCSDQELEALKQYCERVGLPLSIVSRIALIEYISRHQRDDGNGD